MVDFDVPIIETSKIKSLDQTAAPGVDLDGLQMDHSSVPPDIQQQGVDHHGRSHVFVRPWLIDLGPLSLRAIRLPAPKILLALIQH